MSPSTRQPLTLGHTVAPATVGAHARLQQSLQLRLLHGSPATEQLDVPPTASSSQKPAGLVASLRLHLNEQQSVSP